MARHRRPRGRVGIHTSPDTRAPVRRAPVRHLRPPRTRGEPRSPRLADATVTPCRRGGAAQRRRLMGVACEGLISLHHRRLWTTVVCMAHVRAWSMQGKKKVVVEIT
ncbi:hypothetical protein BHE74_00033235 [Ensete ventricosum]|nr:hypothetical protein GW17_00018519 [Ensete ventricosum]RWW59818.1 hypothetical protein BHE74_00033235 [Ensete ventricosum]RZS09648.1 hypothetical protein BHM03_00040740 [Ensete ventricosum]